MPISLTDWEKAVSGKATQVDTEKILKFIADQQKATGKTVSMKQIYNYLKGQPLDAEASSSDWDYLIQDGGAIAKLRKEHPKICKRLNGQLEFKV